VERLIFDTSMLHGPLLSLSLFNTVVLLWLGLTVLLNAARRSFAIWLVGGGLIAAAAFFVSHTIIVGYSATALRPSLNAWWSLGWIGLVFAPYAWYVAMLWHTGYWEEPVSSFRRRHRPALALATLLAVALLAVVAIGKPIPSSMRLSGLYFFTAPLLFGLPLLLLLYPLFVLICVLFSLSALRRPGPISRALAAPARQRARPWLMAASAAVLIVSLLMIDVMIFLVLYAQGRYLEVLLDQPVIEAFWLDLAVSLPISAAVVLLGQAVVSYEVFAGRALPRRGLRRQWHLILVLAVLSSAIAGLTFAAQANPVFTIVVLTVLAASSYAVLGWRSYAERQAQAEELRLLVSSEHAFDALLSPQRGETSGAREPFVALCRDVLGAQCAYLLPSRVLSSLVGGPLSYPPGRPVDFEIDDLFARLGASDSMIVAVDPDRLGGAACAVPLRTSRGLAGVLLLGAKSDGGLYSQEEIEIAGAAGERLLDTLAVLSLAQRLLSLQRDRFIQTQVLDTQSRRLLHDDILPSLHAAMLSLPAAAEGGPQTADALAQLAEVHQRLSALLREMPIGRASQIADLGLFGALREAVQTEFARDFDSVEWQVEQEADERTASLPTLTADVVFYAAKEVIRNAARHGRGADPARSLRLRVQAAWRDGLQLSIADDGVGLVSAGPTDPEGHGLALHSTMLAVIGGSLVTGPDAAPGTEVTIHLPAEAWSDDSPGGGPPPR
jgi:signal transduction histidine kinase